MTAIHQVTKRSVAILLVALSVFFALAACVARVSTNQNDRPVLSILPSTLVDYAHMEALLNPGEAQNHIVEPLIQHALVENLPDHERFYLGQLYFMAFKPDDAYEIFGEFIDRDDEYGWLSRQRRMIIEARAYNDIEAVRASVLYERKNLPFNPRYAVATGFGERTLCEHWDKTGEHNRAIDFALTASRNTPFDAPYGSLYTIIHCFPSFEAKAREAEALLVVGPMLDKLSQERSRRESSRDKHPEYNAAMYENTIQDRWYARSKIAQYNYELKKFDELIDALRDRFSCVRVIDVDGCIIEGNSTH